MRIKAFLTAMILVFAMEIAGAVLYLTAKPEIKQDAVAVNDIVQTVNAYWPDIKSAPLPAGPDYTVVDADGNIIYRTREGLSSSLSEAVRNRDTILDVGTGGAAEGKIFFHNDSAERLTDARRTAATVLITALCIQAVLCLGYVLYLRRTVFRPFFRLKGFALRVAGGDLDIPLGMDRLNVFGAFTESFDILRAELKKAREAEAEANKSKKELVAKLSHDIKTPVASIKSVSEVGRITAATEKDKRSFGLIEDKADQIDALVSNLFQAALEDLQQLSVEPKDYASSKLAVMLKKADYLNRAEIPKLPACLLSFDELRLQQVFDNIISNSYKYAGTHITVTAEEANGSFFVHMEDYGGGVDENELPFLFEKFRRGKNAEGKEGAGLGLFISRYLMRRMGGDMSIKNTDSGLSVTVTVKMSGK